jgi:hypothetical protein
MMRLRNVTCLLLFVDISELNLTAAWAKRKIMIQMFYCGVMMFELTMDAGKTLKALQGGSADKY